MKNPLNLIVSIVAVVLMIGLSLTFYFNKRTTATLTPPNKINFADVAPPEGSVVFADKLGGGNAGGTGGPAAGGFGGGGVPGGRGIAAGGLPPSGPNVGGGLPPTGPPRGGNGDK
jgi:hypothetical protein